MPNSNPASEPSDESVLASAEGMVAEYRRSTLRYLILYRTLKVLQGLTAAAIPTFAAVGDPAWIKLVMALLGALVVVLQGSEGLFRPQDVWVMCRLTLSQLTRERRLFTARAGVYAAAPHAAQLFAERLEEVLQDFDTRWRELRDPRQMRKDTNPGTPPIGTQPEARTP